MDDKKNYADRGECWGPTKILIDCYIKSQFEFRKKIMVISKKVLIYYVLI